MASVERQDYAGTVEVILVPLCRGGTIPDHLEDMVRQCRLICQCHPLVLNDDTLATAPQMAFFPPARMAHQRNLGIARSSGEYIAHLDDDNEWLPNHLSSLAFLLEENSALPAVHSWRHLLWPSGEPYTLDLYPWVKKPKVAYARSIFYALVERGVFRPGSCEVRDCLTSPIYGPLLTVDTSEWLIRRAFHTKMLFREEYTFREVSHALSHDYLFCKDLFESGVHAGCSEHFTLRYRLGGRSTRWLLSHQKAGLK
jgi:glycosyltransferase involved in cell wall biosynthesis